MGVSLVAQKPRALGSQAHQFRGDGAIVCRAAVFSSSRPGAERGLAKIAARRELQEWLDARSRQGDRVFARMAPIGAAARGARDEEIGQALEIRLVEQHEPVFFIPKHILAELSGERRQPLGDCGQPHFGLGRGGGAGAGEIEMIAIEHTRLFGRKAEILLLGVDRVDTLEQSLVQIGLAAMTRENGRDLALDRLQLVIRVSASQIEENARHFVEAAAAALQRVNRIGEGRRFGIGGDGFDLRARLGERRVEGRRKLARLEAVERRRLEWPGPGFEKRVRVDRRGGRRGGGAHASQLGGRAALRNPGGAR